MGAYEYPSLSQGRQLIWLGGGRNEPTRPHQTGPSKGEDAVDREAVAAVQRQQKMIEDAEQGADLPTGQVRWQHGS